MKKRYSRLTRGDRALDVFGYIILTIIVLICAYPIYFVIIASFSSPQYVNSGEMLLYPRGFTLGGYKYVLQEKRIWIGYGNTLIYMICGTMLGVFVNLMAGYSLSRKDLPGRGIIMGLFVVTMYFSGGMIPTFLQVKKLGLLNTRAVLIILGSVSVYNIILIRTYFSSNLAEELRESAFIDGCTNTRFFFQFAVPLSKAIIAVIALYTCVGYWNSYFNAQLYITDQSKYPLQMFLRMILMTEVDVKDANAEVASEMGRIVQIIKYSVIVVSTLPIMCVYPFLQKYFVQGVMIGSLKG